MSNATHCVNIPVTPLVRSTILSKLLAFDVYLKLEVFNPSGSFKDRGISSLLKYLKSNGKKSVICSSGGNAGLAAAVCGVLLGLSVHVIVPEATSIMMRNKIMDAGAKLTVFGDSWQEADSLAQKYIAEDSSIGYVHPFDHFAIWEGHSEIIKEIKDQLGETNQPDAVLLSVGGGGLYAGVVQGLNAVGWNGVEVVTSETQGAESFYKSIHAKELITLDAITSIATTLGAKRVTKQAFDLAQTHPTFPLTVTDLEALNAVKQFLEDHRVLVEPACAATLALLYSKAEILKSRNYKSIVVIVCGGSAVSSQLIKSWEEKLCKPQVVPL
jgi:L-serine/L-threonine ammonia-lyase